MIVLVSGATDVNLQAETSDQRPFWTFCDTPCQAHGAASRNLLPVATFNF